MTPTAQLLLRWRRGVYPISGQPQFRRRRLRRTADKKINSLSLGSFKPYLKPFRDWRDGGITAMRTALAAKKKVVALTADVSAFYHELNPAFLLDPAFRTADSHR